VHSSVDDSTLFLSARLEGGGASLQAFTPKAAEEGGLVLQA
jgi:hypothetical protein